MLIRAAGLPLAALDDLAISWQTADEDILVGQKRLTDATLALQKTFDKAVEVLPDSSGRTAVYNARKVFFQRQKLPGAALTGGLKAFDRLPEMAALRAAIQHFQAADQGLQEARERYRVHYEQALNRGCQALQQIAKYEPFQRALLFASHALLEQLPRFCTTPVEKFAKKERQTALAILQYATRMAVKTSPLSRFTTLTVQNSGLEAPSGTGDFPLPGKAVVAPNVAILEGIYDLLLREPAFYRSLSLRLNPGIVSIPEKVYQWLFFNGEQESVQKADASPPLNFLAEFLLENDRQASFETLLSYLQTGVEAELPALENFILELADLGFLEWVLPENGLSPGWCSGLYQYLGFLPAEPLIIQTAALLQWLRTAARTLPFQPVETALTTLKETREQLRQYFEQFGAGMPPIPVEQIFYEDVEQPVTTPIPARELNKLLEQLASAWVQRPENLLPENRAAPANFLKEICPEGQAIDFQTFAQKYFSPRRHGGAETFSATAGETNTASPRASVVKKNKSPGTVRLGALLQFYRENGQWHAAVNALYPGGGKMFARWLHLFPSSIKGTLEAWVTLPDVITSHLGQPNELHPEAAGSNSKLKTQNSKLKTQNSKLLTPFPWQGWFNANFQTPLAVSVLAVPGGRIEVKPGGKIFLLGNLDLENGTAGPVLRDRVSGDVLELNDLGLEAPETRPPAMRLLWQTGVPFVSLEALLPDDPWQPLYEENIRYRARYTYRDLVLSRAAWALAPTVWQAWAAADAAVFFTNSREALSAMSVPRRFFARFAREKPQYFDQDSPVLMMLFQKMLRQGAGTLFITEMLPTPQQAVVEEEGMRAAEFVVEICINTSS